MCYAIPGKVVEIDDKIAIIDYFGERKKARNEFYELNIGDYVYAQGGFVVQQIPPADAVEILKTWEEFFFKLKETDLRLTREQKSLYQIANAVRHRELGNSCCVHGIIEFSNYCRNDCLYCGLRVSNDNVTRYRLEPDEIVRITDYAVHELGFKAIVFQSGEDLWYDDEKLVYLIRKIRERCGILIILSIGERPLSTYKLLYDEGARGVLLRFETSNEKLYEKIKPGYKLKDRINLLKRLNEQGFLLMTGFLIGLDDETETDILNNINLTGELKAEMFSIGPFIPHQNTPLRDSKKPALSTILDTIARARILNPSAKILATSALETLGGEDGLRQGLSAGANSLMINITPEEYQKLYDIYPDRAGIGIDIKEKIRYTLDMLYSLGRAPTDLGR